MSGRALSLVILSLLAVLDRRAATAAPPGPFAADAEAEVPRIRAHLLEVEETLRARDVGHLSAPLRAARTRNLDHLRAYARRGIFPRNRHTPGARHPIF